MKLLQVIDSVDPGHGGPTEWIRQMHKPLGDLGVKTEVVCCDPPDAPWLESFGVPVRAIGPTVLRYGYSPRLRPWLLENMPDYDAVIVHGLWQYCGLAAWRAARRTGTTRYVYAHGMLGPWFKRKYPLKHFKKALYWRLVESRALRDARAVLFSTEEERILARSAFSPYRVAESVIGQGISSPPETDAGEFLERWPDLRGKRIVLFLGRLHEVKGCDLLLDAFARVAPARNEVELVIAGPDPTGLRSSLMSRAAALGIADRVSWVGMLEGQIKWSALRAAEVVCLPSHHENFGMVIAEALACGRPALISDRVNIWREVEQDGAGFVDRDTVEGTERNLRGWLAMGPDEYAAMSANARACFEAHFTVGHATSCLARVIQGDSCGTRQAVSGR